MKLLTIILGFFTLSPVFTFGQTYGNEWIDYTQQYYSLPISTTGVYRLTYDDLVAANIPVTTFSSGNIQMFGREKEIPLYIQDGGDDTLHSGDYIMFYAEKNDSWLDSLLYSDPGTLATPSLSLYNDTIHYYFSWNNLSNNLRYVQETDIDFASYTPHAYVWRVTEFAGTQQYHQGERNNNSSSSLYTPGEGWGLAQYNGVPSGYTFFQTAPTHLPYSGAGAPNAVLETRVTTASNGWHHSRIRSGNSLNVLADDTLYGYGQIKAISQIPPGEITHPSCPIRAEIVNDLSQSSDRQSLTYYRLEFPVIASFLGSTSGELYVDNHPTESKALVDIANMFYGTPYIFVHGDTPRMVPIVYVPGGPGPFRMLIPNSANGVRQQVIFRDSTSVLASPSLSPINDNGYFTDYGQMPLDSNLLMIYHAKLDSSVLAYESYRTSAAGGAHSVIKAEVNELYHQFGGGIPKHINGIRRFTHFIYNNSVRPPEGLFLVGKGIREANINSQTFDGHGTRFNAGRYALSLVPSYGFPPSDICITAGLEGTSNWAPLLPTGRISVNNSQELFNYLDKVVAYESEQDPTHVYSTATKDWQKQVLHLGGGSNQLQQNIFTASLNRLKDSIEGPYYGGNVTSVFKTSSNPIDPTLLQEVTDHISQGVSLMSYLGHYSGNNGFEINLDDPSNWNNAGKYPVMLVNSCYNGNIFQSTVSNSEYFVQIPNAGAIAYIASVNLGIDSYLSEYSRYLYSQFSRVNYGKTLGEQMMYTVRSLESITSNNLDREATSSQMVLHGDPMLRLNWHQNPEIELLEEGVWFNPSEIDLNTDSIEINIALTNLGKSIAQPFSIEIVRNFPGTSQDSVYAILVNELDYKDTFSIKIPVQQSISLGLNNFTISADIPSQITEQYDEVNNNRVTKTLLIGIDGILPVLPWEFAVVPRDSVTLKASTIDPIADFNTYRFELDTTDLFNSPEFRFALISDFGGIQEVNPSEWLSSAGDPFPLVCEDSTVYFWRVAVDEPTPIWRESSFQYIMGKEGWGQDHFFQFKDNGFVNIDYVRPVRERQFTTSGTRTLTVSVIENAFAPGHYENFWSLEGYFYRDDNYGIGNYLDKLHVGVINPNTLSAWYNNFNGQNTQNSFGNNNDGISWYPNGGRPMSIFTYRQDDIAQMDAFQNLIHNIIPDSFHIVIYSPRGTRYDKWNQIDSADMYDLFYGLGADSNIIDPTLGIGKPLAFYAQKGAPNTAQTTISPSWSVPGIIHAEIANPNTQGTESTPLIGPAAAWGSMYWKQDPQEIPSQDTTILTIKTYDINQSPQYITDVAFTRNDSILNLTGIVDASLYPYISLEASYTDTVSGTPAQIDRWHVLYDPLPEAAIDGSNAYLWSIAGDSIQEGEDIQFAVDVRNIFDIDMDSLLITYWVEDANLTKYPISYPRQDSLRVGETLRDTITFNTKGLNGTSLFWMEVNPYVNGSIYVTDQPEQEHFNNLLQIPFYVTRDEINPLLDVTFDGRHILNGDIVNPYSEVLITLKDENPFMVMDDVSDTTLFGVYLTDPLGNQKAIPFVDGAGNTVMQWIPAEPQHKRFKIVWPAEFDMDGTYTLYVQGADRSGNLSAELEYRVSFEVIHESTITAMMNYPNPFSTSTRFVFTLTGSELPDDIQIQIMTVTGRVVREITEHEIGPLYIGRNVTEFAWDGTDQFGDPLANGVYLYRVKAQINGETIKHRESGADQYFKKEFGKMYLMR